MALSMQTLDFLTENCVVNSRDWFRENKPRYQALVAEPMLALAAQLAPTLEPIDPSMTLEPKRCLSRIWKDMRYSKDPALFRDVMWLAFRRGKGLEYPAFFFEFSPRGWRYGAGCYATRGGVMQILREWVLTDDKRYLDAQAALDALPQFKLEGEPFKKSRYPDAPPKKRDWLERKDLSAICTESTMDGLFADSLHETLASAYRALAPLYHMLLAAYLQAGGAEELP